MRQYLKPIIAFFIILAVLELALWYLIYHTSILCQQ